MHMKMRFTSVIIFNTENASRFLFCSFKAVNTQLTKLLQSSEHGLSFVNGFVR